jgi:hypothetical protein
LLPFEAPEHRGRSILEHITATVTFSDGHTENDQFPYPWVYTDPDADPWSTTNMRNPNFIVRVQFPPSAASASRYSSLIRYILDHTREEDGTTRLQECPHAR